MGSKRSNSKLHKINVLVKFIKFQNSTKLVILFIPVMTTPARRRLMRDFKRLQSEPPEGVSAYPSDNNILLWSALIFGYV